MYQIEDFHIGENTCGYYITKHKKPYQRTKDEVSVHPAYYCIKDGETSWTDKGQQYFKTHEDAEKAINRLVYDQKITDHKEIKDGYYLLFNGLNHIVLVKKGRITDYVIMEDCAYASYVNVLVQECYKATWTPATPLQQKLLDDAIITNKFVNLSDFEKGQSIECLVDEPGQFTKGRHYEVQRILYGEEIVVEVLDDKDELNGWTEDKFKSVKSTQNQFIAAAIDKGYTVEEFAIHDISVIHAPTDSETQFDYAKADLCEVKPSRNLWQKIINKLFGFYA